VINSFLHFILSVSFVRVYQLKSIQFVIVEKRLFGRKLRSHLNLFDEVNWSLVDLLLWRVLFCKVNQLETESLVALRS
jgi:hypothetical protein